MHHDKYSLSDPNYDLLFNRIQSKLRKHKYELYE